MNFSDNPKGIAPERNKPSLSKAQKTFNSLIAQIEKKRSRLMAWEEAIPPFQKKYTDELTPLVEAVADLQVEVVHCLDQVSGQDGLTEAERDMISTLIVEMAGTLLAKRADDKLKDVFNKYHPIDYDSQEAARLASLKALFKVMTGVEPRDDACLRSMEDVKHHVQEYMEEKQAREETARLMQAEHDAEQRKSEIQIAEEEEQQVAAQQITRSLREVYRKLASALHPDRETDPQEREYKTALMQRVNQAYENNNLLLLLELQLELEHIDQSHINNLSEERLAHYNTILKEQLEKLGEELIDVEEEFRTRFGFDPFAPLSPDTILRYLASDIGIAQQSIREMKKDLSDLQNIKKARAWLKKKQRPKQKRLAR